LSNAIPTWRAFALAPDMSPRNESSQTQFPLFPSLLLLPPKIGRRPTAATRSEAPSTPQARVDWFRTAFVLLSGGRGARRRVFVQTVHTYVCYIDTLVPTYHTLPLPSFCLALPCPCLPACLPPVYAVPVLCFSALLC
jgi:hypothetical protein